MNMKFMYFIQAGKKVIVMGFKENLKSIRKEKKLSQKALGELIGKKEITIRNYESGKITPPIKVIEEIAEKLDIPLSRILGTKTKEGKIYACYKATLAVLGIIKDFNLDEQEVILKIAKENLILLKGAEK